MTAEDLQSCNVVTNRREDLKHHEKMRHEGQTFFNRLEPGRVKKTEIIENEEFWVDYDEDTKEYWCIYCTGVHFRQASLHDHAYFKHIISAEEKRERRRVLARERKLNNEILRKQRMVLEAQSKKERWNPDTREPYERSYDLAIRRGRQRTRERELKALQTFSKTKSARK